MQTLFVVKVSYFSLHQFTSIPTTLEGGGKAEEGDRNNDDASGDDMEVEGRHNHDPSNGEGTVDDPSLGEDLDRGPNDGHVGVVACGVCPGEGDPAQAIWKNHHRDPVQKAVQAQDRHHFLMYPQRH